MDTQPETMVLILFGHEYLALPQEQLQEALKRGRELVGKPAPGESVPLPDEVLTAEQMSERTHIPASWYYEAARQGKIPCIKAGKYARFRFAETLAALTVTRGTVTNLRRKSA